MDLSKFKALPIWQHYETINRKGYALDELFSYALPLLDQYYKAFPKYTLHNSEHVYNILKLAGNLLGEHINKLSELECIIIILSAAYHDIGMVYSKQELQNLDAEKEFNTFLQTYYSARLMYINNENKVSLPLAEWYCRWNHATRVWKYLDKVAKVNYGTVNLKNKLGQVCESHGKGALELNNDHIFESNFLAEADLKLCAVVLRLSDILDFDNTRTPKSVYEFLNLEAPESSNDVVSKIEWDKHLCSDGFKFKGNDLTFVAGPTHPQIEKNIEVFLNIIEDELRLCNAVISKSSERWRGLKLPSLIDRQLHPSNYKKGDYSLSLDQKKIISLLTGENLYESQFAFLRELLQNAIDTSRMRIFHEESLGNTNFSAKPVEVSSWIDADGFRWLRIDDYGMGINEYILVNHLLNKGNSFYVSDFFKIQKQEYFQKLGRDFTPISRFGIGLLSCFILGDRIEINSRAVSITSTGSQEERLRLSIDDLESQYVLQVEAENHIPDPMPSRTGVQNGFRQNYGTSLAVRINRAKDDVWVEQIFKNYIEYYISVSPIDVIFNGAKIGSDFNAILSTPIAKHSEHDLTSEELQNLSDFFNTPIDKKISLKIVPINITKNSKTPNLKGQVVVIFLSHNDFFDENNNERRFKFDFKPSGQKIEFIYRVKQEKGREVVEKRMNIDFSNFFKHNFDPFLLNFFTTREHEYEGKPVLIHNGIRIPNNADNRYGGVELSLAKGVFDKSDFHHESRSKDFTLSVIYLQDNLIPNMEISRDGVKNFNFSIYSNLYYSTLSLHPFIKKRAHYGYWNIDQNIFSTADIAADNITASGLWDTENLYFTSKELVSVEEIKKRLQDGEFHITFMGGQFIGSLSRALVALNFEVSYFSGPYSNYYIITGTKKPEEQKIDRYPPLIFIPFTHNSNTITENHHINMNHKLVKWMLANQNLLIDQFERYFLGLKHTILRRNIEEANRIVDYFLNVLQPEIKTGLQKLSPEDFSPNITG